MTYTQWPESLPCPLREGFSVSGNAPTRRTEMETGAARVTRLSHTTVRQNMYSIICNAEQAADFDGFYNVDANAGADWVIIPMYTSNWLTPHKCRFVNEPEREPFGDKWRITFTLETDEQHIDWSP